MLIKVNENDWVSATKEEVEKFYYLFYSTNTSIDVLSKHEYFNKHCIIGGHVMLNGTVETEEEQRIRIFEHSKNKLAETKDTYNRVRFIVIEYVCRWPRINPYLMAAYLISDGLNIVYDDTSIFQEANMIKKRKVDRIAKRGYFNGEGVGSIYIPIKYCPECGRKLGNKKSF